MSVSQIFHIIIIAYIYEHHILLASSCWPDCAVVQGIKLSLWNGSFSECHHLIYKLATKQTAELIFMSKSEIALQLLLFITIMKSFLWD